MSAVPHSALDLIGDTPLVPLTRAYRGGGKLFAKAEFMQPGGSVKDRAAKHILLAARADGRLRPAMPVVEMTSGNMGAGLAVVCAVLGHPLILTMSAGNSPARAAMLEGLDAEVVLIPQADGRPGQVTGTDVAAAAKAARQIAEERGGFYVDQFNAGEGVAAHQQTTGPEILRQIDGAVDAWVACVGTAATFIGVAHTLKQVRPQTLCLAVEPAGSQPLAGEAIAKPRHLPQGTGYGSIPPHWEPELMDESIAVSDDQATFWRRELAVREGLYVGFSAAANVAAAVALLESGRLADDATVVTILCDTGLKY